MRGLNLKRLLEPVSKFKGRGFSRFNPLSHAKPFPLILSFFILTQPLIPSKAFPMPTPNLLSSILTGRLVAPIEIFRRLNLNGVWEKKIEKAVKRMREAGATEEDLNEILREAREVSLSLAKEYGHEEDAKAIEATFLTILANDISDPIDAATPTLAIFNPAFISAFYENKTLKDMSKEERQLAPVSYTHLTLPTKA